MLVSYDRNNASAVISTDIETADKARELVNIFSDVSLSAIQHMLLSDVGKLCIAVLSSSAANNTIDTTAVKALIDEIQAEYLSSDSHRKYVTREALIAELDDVLRAKSITPYRRSRINKALKRACLACQGSGKVPRKIREDRFSFGGRKERWEISINSPNCDHCKGSGINPKEVERGNVPVFDLEQLQDQKALAAGLAWDLQDVTVEPGVHDEWIASVNEPNKETPT